jgi:hypothetical protein
MVVTANVVSSSPILVILMMEALSPSETLVLTRVTRRNISEDVILQCPLMSSVASISCLATALKYATGISFEVPLQV